MLKLGFSIKENLKIYCENVEIPYKNIADALDIDRRSVISAIEKVYEKSELRKIFLNIQPAGLFLLGQNRSIIEIIARSKESGIIADVTRLIAKEQISIRQILATDPDLDPNPKLIIITNREIPGDIIPKILEVNGVKSAKLIKS